jgi:hypothetical protein
MLPGRSCCYLCTRSVPGRADHVAVAVAVADHVNVNVNDHAHVHGKIWPIIRVLR